MAQNDLDLALVLGGGGARAAYQVGLVRCLARIAPTTRFPVVTGVSAGAINAVFLAAHQGTLAEAAEALTDLWSELTFDQVFRVGLSSLAPNLLRWGGRLLSGGIGLAPEARSLVDTAPLRDLLSRGLDTVDGTIVGIDDNLKQGRLKAVALTTLSYTTGQSVTWIQGRDLQTWERPNRRSVRTRLSVDHVMASAALPLLFPAVRLGNAWFGDGGVRLIAPLAPSIHLGADRILVVSTRYARSVEEADRPEISGYPPPAQILGTLLNSIFLDLIDKDALQLDRLNRLLEQVGPEARDDLRPIGIEVLRPSVDLGRLAAGYESELPSAFRFLTRSLGTRETRSPDFLSYVMFHPPYLQRLIEIGERDAEAAGDRLMGLLEGIGSRGSSEGTRPTKGHPP